MTTVALEWCLDDFRALLKIQLVCHIQIYFTMTIAMVGLFGVADNEPSVASDVNGIGDENWSHPVEDPYGRHSSVEQLISFSRDRIIDTNRIWITKALQILNVSVVALSSLGLATTLLLIAGLFKVIDYIDSICIYLLVIPVIKPNRQNVEWKWSYDGLLYKVGVGHWPLTNDMSLTILTHVP